MVFTLTTLLYFVEISVSIKAELGFPPWILSEFKPRYYLPLAHSSRLTIRCSAKNGNISYQWYKNTIKLTTDDRNVISDSNGGINFQTLDKKDFGMYHCTARNKYGVSVSPFFELKEATLELFPGKRNETKTCDEYHYCNVTCSKRPLCEPKYDCFIEWAIGIWPGKSVKFNENIAMDTEGTLHFLNINASNDGKDYFCGIWNEKLKIFTASKKVTTIRVNDVDTFENDVPSEAIYKGDVKAIVGENARLHCIFSGNPLPQMKWLNENGSTISSNEKYKIGDYGRELQIRNVTFDDEGKYTCVSETNLTMSPYLNVTSTPVFPGVESSFLMKYVNFTNEKKVELQCNAKSAPGELNPTVVKWMKNGIYLFPDSSHVFSEENRTLIIIQQSGGCYTCVTENSEGVAVANFLLRSFSILKGKSLPMIITVVIPITTVFILLMAGGLLVQRKTHKHDTNIGQRNMIMQHGTEPVVDISDDFYYTPDDEDIVVDNNVVNSVKNRRECNPANGYSFVGECLTTSSDSTENKIGIGNNIMEEQIYTDPDKLISDHLYYMSDIENMSVDSNVINPVYNCSDVDRANDYSVSGECLSTSSESKKITFTIVQAMFQESMTPVSDELNTLIRNLRILITFMISNDIREFGRTQSQTHVLTAKEKRTFCKEQTR